MSFGCLLFTKYTRKDANQTLKLYRMTILKTGDTDASYLLLVVFSGGFPVSTGSEEIGSLELVGERMGKVGVFLHFTEQKWVA